MALGNVWVLTTWGQIWVEGLDGFERSAVARHWDAVRRYLDTGDESDLEEFDGFTVGGHELETRLGALDWLALLGEVEFESLSEDPQ